MDVSPGERVKNVRCTKDTLRVDLVDGRTIIVPLAGIPGCCMLRPRSEITGRWQAAAMESTGQTSTKI